LGFKDKVKQNPDDLLANDIIEPVAGVGTAWMGSLVIALKM